MKQNYYLLLKYELKQKTQTICYCSVEHFIQEAGVLQSSVEVVYLPADSMHPSVS